jgi:hypothetical protein
MESVQMIHTCPGHRVADRDGGCFVWLRKRHPEFEMNSFRVSLAVNEEVGASEEAKAHDAIGGNGFGSAQQRERTREISEQV